MLNIRSGITNRVRRFFDSDQAFGNQMFYLMKNMKNANCKRTQSLVKTESHVQEIGNNRDSVIDPLMSSSSISTNMEHSLRSSKSNDQGSRRSTDYESSEILTINAFGKKITIDGLVQMMKIQHEDMIQRFKVLKNNSLDKSEFAHLLKEIETKYKNQQEENTNLIRQEVKNTIEMELRKIRRRTERLEHKTRIGQNNY